VKERREGCRKERSEFSGPRNRPPQKENLSQKEGRRSNEQGHSGDRKSQLFFENAIFYRIRESLTHVLLFGERDIAAPIRSCESRSRMKINRLPEKLSGFYASDNTEKPEGRLRAEKNSAHFSRHGRSLCQREEAGEKGGSGGEQERAARAQWEKKGQCWQALGKPRGAPADKSVVAWDTSAVDKVEKGGKGWGPLQLQ